MILYPFPYFRAFMFGTPTIPDIYWNAYSYEERIKKLCCEYDKLIKFTDSMVDTLNSQYEEIESINDNLPELIIQALETPELKAIIMEKVQAYLESMTKGSTYGQIKENGFIYNGGK